MTVCALVKLKDAIVTVADGRLTTGEKLSFDTAEKVVELLPSYKVPIVSMGRISHFSERKGLKWFVAYAGTYALCSEVIYDFRQNCSSLYLDREDGTGLPFLTSIFTAAHSYSNDYNFHADELIEFSAHLLCCLFKESLQKKADEWVRNDKELDCEFLLFGNSDGGEEGEDDRYPAFKITVGIDATLGKRVRIFTEEVKSFVPTCIGEPAAASEIVWDSELRREIEDSIPKASSTDSEFDEWLATADASPTSGVETRLVDIIKKMALASIGGQLLVATARQGQIITLKRM